MNDVVKNIGSACTFCGVVAVSVIAVASVAILVWIQFM